MKKVHNFTAGPCALPQQAIDNAIEALKDFKETGISVISISHRTKEWESVMDECRSLWKELLNIPDTHEVVFLGGGASLGFLYAAMNFLENKAAYLETGVWAKKALKEAKGLGNAYAIASSADTVYNYMFFSSLEDRVLIGFINFNIKYQERYRPIAEEMIQSFRFPDDEKESGDE